jgi:hypothetical protein
VLGGAIRRPVVVVGAWVVVVVGAVVAVVVVDVVVGTVAAEVAGTGRAAAPGRASGPRPPPQAEGTTSATRTRNFHDIARIEQ